MESLADLRIRKCRVIDKKGFTMSSKIKNIMEVDESYICKNDYSFRYSIINCYNWTKDSHGS